MNKTALRKVAEVIEYHDRFNLGRVVALKGQTITLNSPTTVYINDLWTNCNTVGCVAGWTAAWASDEPFVRHYEGGFIPDDVDWDAVKELAMNELGLDEDQANCLFFDMAGSAWEEVYPNQSTPYTAQQAADLLRLVADGGVECMNV